MFRRILLFMTQCNMSNVMFRQYIQVLLQVLEPFYWQGVQKENVLLYIMQKL